MSVGPKPIYKPEQWVQYQHANPDVQAIGKIVGAICRDGEWTYYVSGRTGEGSIPVKEGAIITVIEP